MKSVCIPAAPPVDVARFVPLLDHPLFQKLRERRQLGLNYLVFPGAVHTRFEHALGTLGLTQRLCQIHGLPGDVCHALCAFALLHDIGHGPFSHQIEPIIGGDHNRRGIACLHQMTAELRQCGLDVATLERCFLGAEPLAQFVSDRNLGTDKLDYLRRDALHIGFSGMPDVEKVQFYTVVDDGILAIEEKFIEDVKRVQKFYSYLHQHGYLNKTALSMQRLFQRAVQEALATGDTTPEALWDMTDIELRLWLRQTRSPLARQLMAALDGRQFHRSVLVVKPDGYGFVERRSGKDLMVVEWSSERLRRFSDAFAAADELLRLEDDLAAALGLDRGDILFAAMPYFRKLIPRDVRIFSRDKDASFWLFKKDRDHFRSLEGDYLRTFAVRVVAPPERRAALARQGERIAAFLLERLAAARARAGAPSTDA